MKILPASTACDCLWRQRRRRRRSRTMMEVCLRRSSFLRHSIWLHFVIASASGNLSAVSLPRGLSLGLWSEGTYGDCSSSTSRPMEEVLAQSYIKVINSSASGKRWWRGHWEFWEFWGGCGGYPGASIQAYPITRSVNMTACVLLTEIKENIVIIVSVSLNWKPEHCRLFTHLSDSLRYRK